jgi:hypothetical protein
MQISVPSVNTTMDKNQPCLESVGFVIPRFQDARPFSSFLPGIAGEFGKSLWVFYTNRGQCVCSFGVQDKNGAMLEFHPANKAYTLTSLHGFRTFFKIQAAQGTSLYEPFQPLTGDHITQRIFIRPEEIEIDEINSDLGLHIRVVYFTLPNENLPALVRRVTIQNIGRRTCNAEVLDGLPEIVPFGLEEKLLKQMSRTMEAFAEVRHVEDHLPFFKLKVEPSDNPEVKWIKKGFFAFTVQDGVALPIIADPALVFGVETSLRTPVEFLRQASLDARVGRSQTLTCSAFAQIGVALAPGEFSSWDSFFGQAPEWDAARGLLQRITSDAQYASLRRGENSNLIADLSNQFSLLAGPAELAPYSRQAFLDNTLRGGQPVVIPGPHGNRVFHTFTRKHGDMERDYNFFELAPTYWSQGNGNFRDVNQNRRSENFIFPNVDTANIETFFNLIQLDGNNPLVIHPEKFRISPAQLEVLWQTWHIEKTQSWLELLMQPFSPGALMEALINVYGTPDLARPWFNKIVGLADTIQEASHGEGFWVDHWIYNLDLHDSYAALYPDRLEHLLLGRRDFTYFDNAYIVKPRHEKYVLRPDGTVRQIHAVAMDQEKAALIRLRQTQPNIVRTSHGEGRIYSTTLLTKLLNLMAIKASLLDPFGMGLEMESEKPGWCDALNGLPGLLGSSTHEAFALQRLSKFLRQAVDLYLGSNAVAVPDEVARLLTAVSTILRRADFKNFFPSWNLLSSTRESFRAQTRLGLTGSETALTANNIGQFLDSVDAVLAQGLTSAINPEGVPVSYFINEITEFKVLHGLRDEQPQQSTPKTMHVQALRFCQKPVSSFLEGAVHYLRAVADADRARTLYKAVRETQLFDHQLGMYCVNVPLDNESFEIGRSKIFSPGWLENESIFLHMHYKFLLETLRSGLAAEFFQDFKKGLIAFQDPITYGRSPLENSSFIASSRCPDANVHGVGFVARLSGATAEWISMVLHMGLGPMPFKIVDKKLRFEPMPVLANWLFTNEPTNGFPPHSFGFKLFGQTWISYHNPSRKNTFGSDATSPQFFELTYRNGRKQTHIDTFLPTSMALDLRDGMLESLTITLA